MTRRIRSSSPRPTGGDVDDTLAAASRGVVPTSDDGGDLAEDEGGRERETDVIGQAAGIAIPDGAPLGGLDHDLVQRR